MKVARRWVAVAALASMGLGAVPAAAQEEPPEDPPPPTTTTTEPLPPTTTTTTTEPPPPTTTTTEPPPTTTTAPPPTTTTTTQPAPPPRQPFSDIAGDIHVVNIRTVAAARIAFGYPDLTYRPGRSVTRAQMASFLQRAFDLPDGPANAFSDTVGDTHARAIGAIEAAGITEGYDDGTYRPGLPVAREQMATFLARALGLPLVARNTYPDVSGVHAPAVDALAHANIVLGYPDDLYRPTLAVNRAQMASFIARALGIAPGWPPEGGWPDCAAAHRAGAAPVFEGDPGWHPRLDDDGDGVGCE